MRIMFINPNLHGCTVPNIGLAYVISSAERKHEARLVDFSLRRGRYEQYMRKELSLWRPDVIGFSVNTFNFPNAIKIARLAKEIYPGVTLLYGGVHPTICPEETIDHQFVDAICIGEGEEMIVEYLDKLEKYEEPSVAGVWYKNGKTVRKNKLRAFNERLNDLSFPDWSHWDMDKYLKINPYFRGLTVLTSRGCPYDCSFCSNPAVKNGIPGKYYRVRGPDKVIEEIKLNEEKYRNHGLKNICFNDEVFGFYGAELECFADLFIKEGLNKKLSWSCTTRADLIDSDWAKTAFRAGCALVSMGIESGDDHMRNKVYNKRISNEQIIRAVEILERNNIYYQVSMMIGGPQETKGSIRKSLEFVKNLRPAEISYLVYQPLPKTALAEEKTGISDTGMGSFAESWNWNTLRFNASRVSAPRLKSMILALSFKKSIGLLKKGIQMRGLSFFADLIKLIFSADKCRLMPLWSIYGRGELERKTIHRYLWEDSRKTYSAVLKGSRPDTQKD
jgi:anaerobic magnesium-protoporphyrin IX monomethyl ester cyclase